MEGDYPDEFDHFARLDEEQRAIAGAVLADVRARMTDQALADLVKAGVIQATENKESAARVVAGILTAAQFASKIIGIL